MRTQILYEDNDILVIKKPAGLATQTARVDQPDAASELKKYLGSSYLGIVHRLDQPVEGLLVFGKNKAAASALSAQLNMPGAHGGLGKRYYCVFCGKAPDTEGSLTEYLSRDDTGKAVAASLDDARRDPKAKYASLRYRIAAVAELPASRYGDPQISGLSFPIVLSLADVELQTGRFHQIRAQFAFHGMCLLGDVRYGDAQSRLISGFLGIRSVSLCAYRLDFVHPVSGKPLHFQIRPEGSGFSFFSI